MNRNSERWSDGEWDEKLDELVKATDEWELLAIFVRDRREWLGLDQTDLVEYGGPAKTTISKIERAAERRYSAKTLQQVEEALGWPRGWIRRDLFDMFADREAWLTDSMYKSDLYARFIDAPEPDYLGLHRTVTTPARRAADLSDDELVAELTYRMKSYARTQLEEADETQQEPEQGQGSAPGGGASDPGASIVGISAARRRAMSDPPVTTSEEQIAASEERHRKGETIGEDPDVST